MVLKSVLPLIGILQFEMHNKITQKGCQPTDMFSHDRQLIGGSLVANLLT
jgi:hypothetical protein